MFIGYSFWKEQNTLSFLVHMKHCTQYVTSWATNQASVNLRKLKFYQTSLLTTVILEANYWKIKSAKSINTRKLNIELNLKKILEINDNENMMTQNLWGSTNAVLGWKFISIQSYLKKQEKPQINNLTLHLKQQEKEEQ